MISSITGKSIHEMPFYLLPTFGIGFVCLGYCNTEETGIFKDSNLLSHSSRDQKSEIKVVGKLVSSWFIDRWPKSSV